MVSSISEIVEWQPIESAPKDGTWFLTYDGNSIFPMIRMEYWGSWDDERDLPTHWMPLPELPTNEK